MQNTSSIWHFFSSVKLALTTLFLIAATSVIGTLVPQKEPANFYVDTYGPTTAELFRVLDISDMYNSWWFLALLGLLCLNLIICSLDRLPGAWKQIKADGLAHPRKRLYHMSNRFGWRLDLTPDQAHRRLASILAKKGWKNRSRTDEGATIIFSEKGAWTRLGVYIVHSSILVIFLGAVIGLLGGFKGFVMIPETAERTAITIADTMKTKDLDFTIRCNYFTIEYYPGGMPKEFISSLTILEDNTEILTKEIEVNSPLTYKGITFYQSSYDPIYPNLIINISTQGTDEKRTVIFPYGQQVPAQWREQGIQFGITNIRPSGQPTITGAKIWFSDGVKPEVEQWIDTGSEITIKRGDRSYRIEVKQMYATGLQVAKDPGVWWVYLGCCLMLFGLYVAFFQSHRRVWLLIEPEHAGSRILLCGSAHKNRPAFSRTCEDLHRALNPEQIPAPQNDNS